MVLCEVVPLLQVEEVSLDQLDAVGREWVELCSRCPCATVFQYPQWLIPWCRNFAPDRTFGLTFRRDGMLQGLAVFTVSGSVDGADELLLAGNGITDYLGILYDPESRSEVMTALLEYLRTRFDNCRCDFQQLRGDSPLVELTPGPEWHSALTVQEVCPVLPLPPRIDDLPRTHLTSMLGKVHQYQRRIAKVSPIRVEMADAATFEEILTRLFELHRARWVVRAESGVLEPSAVQNFHSEAARRMLEAGMLRLYGLRVGLRIIATLYGFTDHKSLFYYLGGSDPEYASFSPGTILIGHAIQDAVEDGLGAFDFLRGRETYKYLWGAKGQVNYRRRFWRRTIYDKTTKISQEVRAEHV